MWDAFVGSDHIDGAAELKNEAGDGGRSRCMILCGPALGSGEPLEK